MDDDPIRALVEIIFDCMCLPRKTSTDLVTTDTLLPGFGHREYNCCGETPDVGLPINTHLTWRSLGTRGPKLDY